MGTEENQYFTGETCGNKMRWMSVRLSDCQEAGCTETEGYARVLQGPGSRWKICVSNSRGSWNFNKSFEVAKLPFSSFPAPKFFAHLIWIPQFSTQVLVQFIPNWDGLKRRWAKWLKLRKPFRLAWGWQRWGMQGTCTIYLNMYICYTIVS